MIIANPVIKLDYNPGQDILSIQWPDFNGYSLSEAAYTLDVVVETVKCYDVKHLLTDTRKGAVEIPESRYREMVLKFAKGLAATRLRKVARIVTKRTLREKPVNEVMQEACQAVLVESFYSREEALRWLAAG